MAYFRSGTGGGGGGQTATGTFVTNTSASSGYKITTGFRPKLVYVVRSGSTNISAVIYAYDIDANKYLKALPSSTALRNFESANFVSLVSIDNDGFTIWTNDAYKTHTWNYFASA